ncbi:efflux RND transporter periplasmic adaptor subunit [Coraliomargarita sp. SDUM461003]|uniref:Efflux RND transporter periplasmic adaptor subunit n=1 Tax=Thalassobacterium maritimum TaxID=3041265 RepID=A0ABU1AZ81_9BACT|nr:efflux RND transporter periplasmic adaptor subunit [Coraliomargarita sp. SDUM461003]MDQ8209433.1 efflux RND transporter periplasmic adaptor subunit [Coraliomargarita sp. SDUM461003]
MNKQLIFTITGTAVAALIIGIGVGRLTQSSHESHQHAAGGAASAQTAEAAEPTIWTCSMHPQIQQAEPGDCPICGMDLIPLENDSGADDGPRTMSMSESSRALAEIQTSAVVQDYPEAEIRLVGKLDYDETLEKSLTARFPARIDELFVNYTGIPVAKGDHLAKVYSPDLLSAQRELLTSYRADPNSSITRAAREKLRLWDLVPEQIDAILESGEAKDHFILKAPIGGVVVAKHVKEGDYVKTGESLFKIVDLSRLWAYLDAYESDLPWLRYGQDVSFSVEAIPGEIFHGQVAFIEPEVNRKTRTVPIRVNVPNPDSKLKPGMFVRAIVASRLAEGGKVYAPDMAGKWISPMHPEIVKDGPGQCDVCGMDLVRAEELGYVDNAAENAPIIVPSSAVLRTGKRAVVYVEKPNAERPTYEGREVVLGPRAGDYFLVAAGLDAGERVVTNGAFKIDSALQIQAKPSMMNPQGGGPTAGHNHGGEAAVAAPAAAGGQTDHSQHGGMAMLEIAGDLVPQLVEPYLAMQSALAGDDLALAKAQAKAMMEVTGHSGDLAALLHDMLAAETLDAFRIPYFDTLSNALIAAAKADPASFDRDFYIMNCSMAKDNQGADWLQASKSLQNPYFGAMMLQCGEVKETITASESGHENHGQ